MAATNENKAKVFISCGQKKGTDETDIALKIGNVLRELGFEFYIATEEHTLKGFRENIFHQLETSEYILFIDFRREQIGTDGETPVYRGSLFSHQELAIASYLEIPSVAFQESNVCKRDGLLGVMQLNCLGFKNRDELPEVVRKYVSNKWDAHWRNELFLERGSTDYKDVIRVPSNAWARFFHIKVTNRNKWKSALNCYSYLKSIKNVQTNATMSLETIELKWKGVNSPSVPIHSYRYLDAVFVDHNLPTRAYPSISPSVDYSGYFSVIQGPGDFDLEYLVLSQNFRPATAGFRLHLGNTLNDITLTKC